MHEGWNTEEVQRLTRLRLDPVQDAPAKLIALVEHFKGQTPSIFAVTEGNGPVSTSKALARKVRGLTRDGKLDWLLDRVGQPGGARETGDVELGPHGRELFAFGTRFRDRFTSPSLKQLLDERVADGRSWYWHRESGVTVAGREARAIDLEAHWRWGSWDAREHPCFPSFQEHLATRPCWELLERAEVAVRFKADLARRAHAAIHEEVVSRLPGGAEADWNAFTWSLLQHGDYLTRGPTGLPFTYEPRWGQDASGRVVWRLALGAWTAGAAEDPDALEPLAAAHLALAADVPIWPQLPDLAEASRAAEEAARSFRESLAPDARLRKWLLHSRCELCP